MTAFNLGDSCGQVETGSAGRYRSSYFSKVAAEASSFLEAWQALVIFGSRDGTPACCQIRWGLIWSNRSPFQLTQVLIVFIDLQHRRYRSKQHCSPQREEWLYAVLALFPPAPAADSKPAYHANLAGNITLRTACPCCSFFTDTLPSESKQASWNSVSACMPTTEELQLHFSSPLLHFPPPFFLIILIMESAANGWNELLSSPPCQWPLQATQFPPDAMA